MCIRDRAAEAKAAEERAAAEKKTQEAKAAEEAAAKASQKEAEKADEAKGTVGDVSGDVTPTEVKVQSEVKAQKANAPKPGGAKASAPKPGGAKGKGNAPKPGAPNPAQMPEQVDEAPKPIIDDEK